MRQIEQRVTHVSEQIDPVDFRLTELFEAVYLFECLNDDIIPIMHSEPVVERRLPSRTRNLDVLPKSNLCSSGRKTHIAVDELRPEPDPVNQASGRKFDNHESLVRSVTSYHNMQLTQFSTSVPSSAIWRSRM